MNISESRRIPRLACTMLVMLMAARSVQAQVGPDARATLKDLRSVWVVVDGPDPALADFGLTKGQLKTEVELSLRKAGVDVVSDPKGASAMLDVIFECLESPDVHGYYMYVIDVRLFQDVILARDRSIKDNATTWSVVRDGFCGRKDLPRLSRELRGVADAFANAYLEQNPLRRSSRHMGNKPLGTWASAK